jgi:hypothetical protein
MNDGELELLAREAASLTESARAVLQAEMKHRGLHVDLPSDDLGHDAVEWDDLVVIRKFRDLPEALLAKGSLDSADIESFLSDDNMVRMDWFISNLLGGIKLCVREKDAEAALEVLEQSIPADFDVEGVGNYSQPTCPLCQSLDISFESLNKPIAYTTAWVGVPIPVPRKRWKCNGCGHVWPEDNPSAPNEENA